MLPRASFYPPIIPLELQQLCIKWSLNKDEGFEIEGCFEEKEGIAAIVNVTLIHYLVLLLALSSLIL